jgi:hypothetical protein
MIPLTLSLSKGRAPVRTEPAEVAACKALR